MRHFLNVSVTIFRDEEFLFSRNFQKLRTVSCAILTDPKQGRRLQMLHFSSFGTNTKHLFPFSKEVAQNAEVFVEYSQSRVREKRMHAQSTNINRQKCLSKVTKKASSSALYLREKVAFARFWRNL